MKKLDEIEKIKRMNDKELFKLVRENKKVQNDKKYFKENFDKYKKLYTDLLGNKDNNLEEFAFQQKKAAFYKLNTWNERIIFAIRTENKFLTSVEIFNVLLKYNYDLSTLWRYPMGTLRQNIHLAVGYGLIKSVIFRGRHSHYYGISSFYDSSGNLKPEFKEQLNNI